MKLLLTAKKSCEVASLEEASRAVRAHIEGEPGWIGGREWDRFRRAGIVLDDQGRRVARVHYNVSVEELATGGAA